MSDTPLANTIDDSSWCDATLRGLWWENDGRDFVVRMQQLGTGPNICCAREVSIVCRHSYPLEVSLQTGPAPMTWDGKLTRDPDGSWSVLLDFASAGEIRLRCQEIEVRPVDGPSGQFTPWSEIG